MPAPGSSTAVVTILIFSFATLICRESWVSPNIRKRGSSAPAQDNNGGKCRCSQGLPLRGWHENEFFWGCLLNLKEVFAWKLFPRDPVCSSETNKRYSYIEHSMIYRQEKPNQFKSNRVLYTAMTIEVILENHLRADSFPEVARRPVSFVAKPFFEWFKSFMFIIIREFTRFKEI